MLFSVDLVILSGISPIHLAAIHNNDDARRILIEAGFDTNSLLSAERACLYEHRRLTALYFAVANNYVDAATMLLEAGADPNLDTFNPLLVAVRRGCTELVTPLVEHRANINVRMPNFPTVFPVTVMICNNRLSLLQYLLDNGCDATSCFECEHGRGPHSAITELVSGNTELQYRLQVNMGSCLELLHVP